MEIKVDGSSVEFYRGLVGLTTLGTNAATVEAVVARASYIISEVS